MKKNEETKKDVPEITEPTEIEIKQTIKIVKKKSNIILPKPDAIKFAKLTQELNWWLKLPTSPKRITEEMISEYKDLVKKVRGKDIPAADVYDDVRSLFVMVTYKEKDRLSKEMRAILVTHKEVLRDPITIEKVEKLLQLHYGVKLTTDQLEQLVPYLTKQIWFQVGIDESLEKCLDDLLVYADKRKRGIRVNGLKLHSEMKKVIDWSMTEMKVAGEVFDPLYRKQD